MDSTIAPRRLSSLWVAGLAMGALLVLLAVLYAGIVSGLVAQWWDDPNYSHGFLVPFFSAFIVWQRRREIARARRDGSSMGLVVLLLGVAALILGQIGAENFLMRSSLVVIIAGLVLFHLGGHVFRLVLFPLLFLFFMIPLPSTIFYAVAFPLQGIAARNAATTLDLLGVPVLLDGNVIHLSHLSLGVTEACSGIRSLISLLALALGWAYVTLPGVWGMAVLAVAAVPITIVANAGRVVSTGLIGQWFGIHYAQGFFHTFSGWVIFVFAFAGLLAVHGLIRVVMTVSARRRA